MSIEEIYNKNKEYIDNHCELINVLWNGIGWVKTYGKNLNNGYWYIYLPQSDDWHHIENKYIITK